MGRVVAHLLQAQQRCQHHAAPLDPRLVRRTDPLQRLLDHRFVQGGLLSAQVAVDLHLQLVRQVLDDGGVGLEAAQDEGPHQPFQPFDGRLVLVAFDGQGKTLAEPGLRAQEPRIEELHDGPQFGQPILHRRAGQGDTVVGRLKLADGLRLLGLGILDVLRLVEDHVAPGHLPQILHVPPRQAVGADNHVVLLGGGHELLTAGAITAVMHHHPQTGGKALDLAFPVADDRGGADDQRRADAVSRRFALVQQQGDSLDGLAQAHVVGQASAQSPLPQESQPGIAAHLVRPQPAHKAPGRRQFLQPLPGPQLLQEVIQPARGFDAVQRQPSDLLGSAQSHPQRLAQGHLALLSLLLPESDGGLDLLGLEQHPLAAYPHQGHLERRQPLEFLKGQRLVAQGQLPVELYQRIHVEDAPADDAGLGLEFGPHAQASAGFVPPGRHQHAEAAPLQQRSHLPQEGVGVIHGQGTRFGAGRAQAVHDRREELPRQAQPGQQPLLSPLELAIKDAQGAAARPPHLPGRHQQARVVAGLEDVTQGPVGREYLSALRIHLRRLQPEAEAERRLGRAAQLAPPFSPGVEQTCQVTALRHQHFDPPLIVPQRRPPRAGHARRRFAPPVQARRTPVAPSPVNQLPEKIVQQGVRCGSLVRIGRAIFIK